MSKVEYTRCDMCGDLLVDDSKAGHFWRESFSGWAEGWAEDSLDLCGGCADEVQRFIRAGRRREGGDAAHRA